MQNASDTDGKFEQTESCLYLTERKYHYFYLTDQAHRERGERVVQASRIEGKQQKTHQRES